MNLYEYQAKKIFSKFHLPVLDSWLCTNTDDVAQFIQKNIIHPPWTVKCQIHAGGRGKSGGVCIVRSRQDLIYFIDKWIGKYLITSQTTPFGEIVNHILIEPTVNIVHEFYISVLIDRDTNKIVCMVSVQGGVDIEKLARGSSDAIFRICIDPEIGAYPYQGRILACKLGLTGDQINQFVNIFLNMIKMFLEMDLTLLEINPLAMINKNCLICLDAKVIMDHNALFRQVSILKSCGGNNQDSYLSNDGNCYKNMNYVDLDGNIGCMVNGAGLAMATMDLMKTLGGAPANFLDIGGDTDKNSIVLAFKMLLENTKIKAILVNVFGGIVCCDLVADSIITAISECMNRIPIIVRLAGNNSILGIERLTKNNNFNIVVIDNLVHAIQRVIKLAE